MSSYRLVAFWPLVFVTALLLACDGGRASRDVIYLGAGIEGVVTIGPMCPVVREDTPCPDQPYQADITILDEDGDEVATFETTEDGRFSAGLFPGRYTVVPHSPNPGAPPTVEKQEVVVRDGEYTQVEISYDSGIR